MASRAKAKGSNRRQQNAHGPTHHVLLLLLQRGIERTEAKVNITAVRTGKGGKYLLLHQENPECE